MPLVFDTINNTVKADTPEELARFVILTRQATQAPVVSMKETRATSTAEAPIVSPQHRAQTVKVLREIQASGLHGISSADLVKRVGMKTTQLAIFTRHMNEVIRSHGGSKPEGVFRCIRTRNGTIWTPLSGIQETIGRLESDMG